MKKYSVTFIILVCISSNLFGQVKFGSGGLGGSIGFRNNITFRINPISYAKQKKELNFEVQYSHSIWTEDYNKLYIGVGAGNKWINLHYANDRFITQDYQVAHISIPIGIEYYPFTNNNKFSFQLESGPQLDFSRLELDPGRTLNFYYHLRGLIELNYYFRRNTSSKY